MNRPDQNPDGTGSRGAEARELCPNCLAANVEGANFCRKCGGPLSAYAAIGPWERLFAEGHIYRKAAEQPRKLIVVLGIWLIFGPVAFMGGSIALIEWNSINVLQQLLLAGLVVLSLLLIARTTWNYILQKLTSSGSPAPAPGPGRR